MSIFPALFPQMYGLPTPGDVFGDNEYHRNSSGGCGVVSNSTTAHFGGFMSSSSGPAPRKTNLPGRELDDIDQSPHPVLRRRK